VVTRIEYSIKHKDIALVAFLDIEEALDRTSFDIIKQTIERHGIEPAICRWICAMLESRNIRATLPGETLVRPRQKGARREQCFLLYCGAWSWMISFGGSTVMVTIQ
jgi:hypothetical protein